MREIKGIVNVLKVDGTREDVEYIITVDRYKDQNEADVKKTIEDKIKNLALLMEKIPIDTQKFLESLHIQLAAELGKYGLAVIDTKLAFPQRTAQKTDEQSKSEEVAK